MEPVGPVLGATLVVVSLLVFAGAAVRSGRTLAGRGARDAYLSARGTQSGVSLALSFFASALGAWILFSPAEVGTFAGALGIAGYALGQAAAVAVFALLGPAVVRRLPEGTTILEWVRIRFGRVVQLYAGGVSVLYMFVFLTAELTAIGGVVALTTGTARWVPVVAVAAVTAAYTAYGGLPASLATDRWQAWLVLALVAAGAIAIGSNVTDPGAAADAAGAWQLTRPGLEVAVVLVIAVTAANLFHQGLWQRAWAARDREALVAGAVGGGVLVVPLLVLTGLAGAVAAGRGGLADPSAAFFSLLDGLPSWTLAAIVVLAVTLVASTADTLENALTSIVAVHLLSPADSPRTGSLTTARWITIALAVPAAAIAVEGVSVLRLFLVADLLAVTIAVPVFSGLWRRASAAAALSGALAGLLAVVAVGWVDGGTVAAGVRLLSLPEGPTLAPFLAAATASTVVTVAVALATPAVSDGPPARRPAAVR